MDKRLNWDALSNWLDFLLSSPKYTRIRCGVKESKQRHSERKWELSVDWWRRQSNAVCSVECTFFFRMIHVVSVRAPLNAIWEYVDFGRMVRQKIDNCLFKTVENKWKRNAENSFYEFHRPPTTEYMMDFAIERPKSSESCKPNLCSERKGTKAICLHEEAFLSEIFYNSNICICTQSEESCELPCIFANFVNCACVWIAVHHCDCSASKSCVCTHSFKLRQIRHQVKNLDAVRLIAPLISYQTEVVHRVLLRKWKMASVVWVAARPNVKSIKIPPKHSRKFVNHRPK